jgi:ribosomal protein L37AE/L43A
MLPTGPDKPLRRLIWLERDRFGGWGCSKCGWVFNPSGWPAGKSLDEQIEKSQKQLSGEFESHACDKHHQR